MRANQPIRIRSTLVSGLSVGGAEDFCGGDYGVGVDGDGVFDPDSVSASEGHHDGDVAGASGAVDNFVALLKSFDREVQSAELLLTEGSGTSDVADKFGRKLTQSRAECMVEPGEISGVIAAVGQIHIDGGPR